ncbi:MAG: phage tail protein [Gammaproteobacteria bacterium]
MMRRDPFQAFNFQVEIEGIVTAGFSECSGLQAEIEVFPYSEGGVNGFEHQFLGRTKYPRLVLKRGLTPIDGLWGWYWEVAQGAVQRKNGTIYLLDGRQRPILGWHFLEALPVKWAGPELRADSATVAFESVDLVHRGLNRETVR